MAIERVLDEPRGDSIPSVDSRGNGRTVARVGSRVPLDACIASLTSALSGLDHQVQPILMVAADWHELIEGERFKAHRP